MQSYYAHEVAICEFEPDRVRRRRVDVGEFAAEIMGGFSFEDSGV